MSKPKDDDSGGFTLTAVAWPAFFLALAATFRESEDAQCPSTGVRSLLRVHLNLNDVEQRGSFSERDLASLRKMMELLHDMGDNPPGT